MAAAQLFKIVKPQTTVEKKTRTVVDTIMVTPTLLEKWKSPPFQRPVRENEKVRALAEEMKNDGGVWPGIVTLGMLQGECYLLDGQHRKAAFLMSAVCEGYTDVRTHYFETMAQMGEEFVRLNSQLVRMRPDDILRGLEASIPGLKKLRMACPFVGYDYIRRNTTTSPVVGVSVVLRNWRGSCCDVPTAGGLSAAVIAQGMTDPDWTSLIEFLQLAMAAFGRDHQYARLWTALNMVICMWMYRRLVLNPEMLTPGKVFPVSKDLFKKCLMAISASSEYIDWLGGRALGERDRGPTYSRLKAIFAARLTEEMGVSKKVSLPQPAWSLARG